MSVTGTPITASDAKLAAVNKMIKAVGQYRVDALDTGGVSVAGEAELVLDEISREIQEEGWYENREPEAELTPDGSDNVLISSDIIRVDTRDSSVTLNVSIRNGKLYDLDDETDEFDEDTIYATIIRELSFDNLSDPLRELVTAQACVTFQREWLGSEVADKLLVRKLVLARAKALRSEQRNADVNILDSTFARRIRGEPTETYRSR